jgi:hypothetical protein
VWPSLGTLQAWALRVSLPSAQLPGNPEENYLGSPSEPSDPEVKTRGSPTRETQARQATSVVGSDRLATLCLASMEPRSLLSDAEIAEQLFTTSKTTSNHVANILTKLGATNRRQPATIAV